MVNARHKEVLKASTSKGAELSASDAEHDNNDIGSSSSSEDLNFKEFTNEETKVLSSMIRKQVGKTIRINEMATYCDFTACDVPKFDGALDPIANTRWLAAIEGLTGVYYAIVWVFPCSLFESRAQLAPGSLGQIFMEIMLYRALAVIVAAQRKRVKYEAKYAYIGYDFLPFSFSSFAKLEKDAMTLLKRVRRFFVTQNIRASTTVHISNRISFTITRRSSPLTQIGMTDFVPGRVVIDVSQRKRVKYEAKFANIKYSFFLSHSLLLGIREGCDSPTKADSNFFVAQDIGARVFVYIFSRVTFAIAKGRRESAFAKPDHMIASSESRNSSKNMPRFSSNDMVHNHYLDEARKKTQERDKNSKTSVMPFDRFQSTTDGRKPKPRSNNHSTRSLPVSKSSCVTITTVPIAYHSKNSNSFLDSMRFVCSTCHKCVLNANHDACITKFLKEVNSHAKIQSNKTRNSNKPVEQKSHTQKLIRQIFIEHRFYPNKTSDVYEKTSPISDLRWKLTCRIFKNVGLMWVPTGKILASCTSKDDSEPTHGLNVDIPYIYKCKQSLDLSASTSINVQKEQSFDLSARTSNNAKPDKLIVCLLKKLIS
nr:hypothetical protein [Tanacetum cinerariifolium]